MFDLGESFIQRKQFAQMRLAFEPHVLSGILLWSIASKPYAGVFPVGLGQVGILLR